MTEVNVYDLEGNVVKQVELPDVFNYDVRPDIIRRVVRVYWFNRRQPYGASPMSGMRHSAESWGPGHGMSRIPRIKDSSRGAQAPSTVGGRPGHPPKAEKVWYRKVNKKEKRLAKFSALSATKIKELVRKRGHRFNDEITLPIIVVDDIETVAKTINVIDVLDSLGVGEDIDRAKSGIKIRAGKGKRRGRKYKRPKSVLIIVKEKRGIERGARNIPGVDVVAVDDLNVEHLAPGGVPGRLTIITESALEVMRRWSV